MSGSGLSALINTGAWLANEFDMEALSCGTAHDADWALELAGKWLLFRVTIHTTEIHLGVVPMDSGDPPEHIVRFPDNPSGWDTLRRLCGALERNAIRSMHPRPVEVPSDWEHPDDGWIIA